jgi:uncharacterized membrane protein
MNIYGKILAIISVIALFISIYYIVAREIQVSGFNNKQEMALSKLDTLMLKVKSLEGEIADHKKFMMNRMDKDSSAIQDILELAKKYTGDK